MSGSPCDGAVGRSVTCSMTAGSMVANIVFSDVGKHPSYRSLIESISRSMFSSSALMYCSLSTCPNSLRLPLRCLHHPSMLPSRKFSSISLPYTSRYLSIPTTFLTLCMLLAKYAMPASLDSPSRTVDLALCLRLQPYSNSVRIVASSGHPIIRGFRVRRGTMFSAALWSALVKFAARVLTVLPCPPCLSSLIVSLVSWSRLSVSDVVACPSIGSRPIGICVGLCVRSDRAALRRV